MEVFLSKKVKWNKFELFIDNEIFSKDIILNAAYQFLDLWYFFFKVSNDGNIILQFTPKSWVKKNPEEIIWDFYDELINVYLRKKIEAENKTIREWIVLKAIWSSIDSKNYVSIDPNQQNNQEQNQIDFDKDIDEILKEIENDPELKIDEEEIERILKEIEEETESEIENNNINNDNKTHSCSCS